MTQEELAAAAGLSLQYVSEVERGIANPKLETILRLAAGLHVPPIELFYLQDLPECSAIRRRKLASILTRLDEQTLNTIYRLLLSAAACCEDIDIPLDDNSSDIDL